MLRQADAIRSRLRRVAHAGPGEPRLSVAAVARSVTEVASGGNGYFATADVMGDFGHAAVRECLGREHFATDHVLPGHLRRATEEIILFLVVFLIHADIVLYFYLAFSLANFRLVYKICDVQLSRQELGRKELQSFQNGVRSAVCGLIAHFAVSNQTADSPVVFKRVRDRKKIVHLDTLCEEIRSVKTFGHLLKNKPNLCADFTGQFPKQMQQVPGLGELLQFLPLLREVGDAFDTARHVRLV